MNNLNEHNLQAPFMYKPSENTFNLERVSGEIFLNSDSNNVSIIDGEDLFCACIGYSIDGSLEDMEFFIDNIKVYPKYVNDIQNLRDIEFIKENEIYLIENNIDFKSIIYFPIHFINKKFNFNITTYNSVFTSYMFDNISKKLNTLDINYPILNFKKDTLYRVNDIIKNNGYLYKVNKEFISDSTDYHLNINTSLLTPFKRLENGIYYKVGDIIEYRNIFYLVQASFTYEDTKDSITNLSNLIKPLISILNWDDNLDKIYKNQILIKDGLSYIVIEDVIRPVWINLISNKKIERLNTAKNTFFDDINTNLDVDNIQDAIEKLNKKINNSSSTPGASSNEAYSIYFDNSKTNLEYTTDEYIFPKFKIQENSIINITLIDDKEVQYPATIVKNSEDKYTFSFEINNCSGIGALLKIHSIDDLTNSFKIFSKLSQFFEFNTVFRLSSNEALINGVEVNMNMYIDYNSMSIMIGLDEDSNDNLVLEDNFTLTANISNRHLKKEDTNIFYLCSDKKYVSNFELVEDTGTVRLKGFYKASISNDIDGFYFYSPIIENYFNLIDSMSNLNPTLEIVSNKSKQVQYGISDLFLADEDKTKIYLFYFSYVDESKVEIGDEFTFNLTVEKNYKLENIKKNVDNIQELGEVLSSRVMLPPYYIQFSKEDGSFDINEEPTTWYKNMYNINTTWELVFNTESIYFRTEGDKSNLKRNKGIQPYGMKNLSGGILTAPWGKGVYQSLYGIVKPYGNAATSFAGSQSLPSNFPVGWTIDTKTQMNEYSDDIVVSNRLIRIYKLLSIN